MNGSLNCRKKQQNEQLSPELRDAKSAHETSIGCAHSVPPEDDVQPLSDDAKAAFFDKLSEFFDGMTAKENPAVLAAGLTNDSDQASAFEFTGEEFVAAIRTVLQARRAVEITLDYAKMINGGRVLECFEDDEWKFAVETVTAASVVYSEMFRSQVRVDFKKIMGVKKSDFEDAMLTCQRFFWGAE